MITYWIRVRVACFVSRYTNETMTHRQWWICKKNGISLVLFLHITTTYMRAFFWFIVKSLSTNFAATLCIPKFFVHITLDGATKQPKKIPRVRDKREFFRCVLPFQPENYSYSCVFPPLYKQLVTFPSHFSPVENKTSLPRVIHKKQPSYNTSHENKHTRRNESVITKTNSTDFLLPPSSSKTRFR